MVWGEKNEKLYLARFQRKVNEIIINFIEIIYKENIFDHVLLTMFLKLTFQIVRRTENNM